MAVERFEDFVAWQKARVPMRGVYAVTRSSDFAKDFDLVRQVRRAFVFAMSNVAEDYERIDGLRAAVAKARGAVQERQISDLLRTRNSELRTEQVR